MIPKTILRNRLSGIQLRHLALLVCTFGLLQATYAQVKVGPQVAEKPAVLQKQSLPDRFDLVPMRLAVSVFHPGYDLSSENLESEGVWPELRNVESMRIAVKLKQAIIGINQFHEVLVVPDTSVSADFFLLGSIRDSTGEVLSLRYSLVDSTGKQWITAQAEHRVELGWHQRFGHLGIDPFTPLYTEVANEVWKVIKKLDADHRSVSKRRSKSKKLSQVETLHAVRAIVAAQYFNSAIYGDALRVASDSKTNYDTYQINFLPDQDTEDWLRIDRLRARDNEFLQLLDQHYEDFYTEVNPTYEDWQEESFPIAREIRLAKRSKTISKISAIAAGIITAAIAADADTTSQRDTALAAGGAVTAGLLVNSWVKKQKANTNLARFNEMSQSYHDGFISHNVEAQGNVISLVGTATEQYQQWQDILRNLYEKEQDVGAVEIVTVED